jgi:anti-sigma B factor antagonist
MADRLIDCLPAASDTGMRVEAMEGEIANVVLSGRLDSVGAASLAQRFKVAVADKRAVIVDLSDVDFVASLAIRFLVAGVKAVKSNGGKLVILSPQEYVHDTLKSAAIDAIIPILFDRSEGVAAVRP